MYYLYTFRAENMSKEIFFLHNTQSGIHSFIKKGFIIHLLYP